MVQHFCITYFRNNCPITPSDPAENRKEISAPTKKSSIYYLVKKLCLLWVKYSITSTQGWRHRIFSGFKKLGKNHNIHILLIMKETSSPVVNKREIQYRNMLYSLLAELKNRVSNEEFNKPRIWIKILWYPNFCRYYYIKTFSKFSKRKRHYYMQTFNTQPSGCMRCCIKM